MPIFVAASAAFVAMSQNICRPGVGRASAGRQYQTYLIPSADVVRASATGKDEARFIDNTQTKTTTSSALPKYRRLNTYSIP